MVKIKKIIKELAPPIFLSIIGKAINLFDTVFNKKSDKRFVIEGLNILLPPNHKLDEFQRKYPTYDKFITIISKYIPEDSVVIDIGANVGDSAIPFLIKKIKTVCVEPSSYYLKYLYKNIYDNNFSKSATIVNKLISTSDLKIKMTIKNGTASIRNNDDSGGFTEEINDPISLDYLVKELSNISFIKIDTDGFDFDVINSGRHFFTKNKPLILFENTINDINQKYYEDVYAFLEENGYTNISVFSNRGLLILHKANWGHLKNLNTYIKKDGYKNIPYTDVFCYQDIDKQTVDCMVNEFVQKFM